MSIEKCDPANPAICGHPNCLTCLYKAWPADPIRQASVNRVIERWKKPVETAVVSKKK